MNNQSIIYGRILFSPLVKCLSLTQQRLSASNRLAARQFELDLKHRKQTDQFLAANRVENGQLWFVIIDKTSEMKREEEITNLELALVELYESLLGDI
jgi:hypothetical protein